MGFGGNTCCAVIDIEGENPIILDMGSGLFGYAMSLGGSTIQASVLLTHLHWDHVAGLPFFSPVLCPGGALEIYGPPDEGRSLEEAVRSLVHPPFFPITIDDFGGDLSFHDTWDTEIAIGATKVVARPVPHTNATNGYRVDIDGRTVVYIPDHQQPSTIPTVDQSIFVADSVLELCEGADLLIHDGQYPRALFEKRSHWGHSTPAYAVEVARRSGVKSLALFSHDPLHTDDELESIEATAQELAAATGDTTVFSAREGLRFELT